MVVAVGLNAVYTLAKGFFQAFFLVEEITERMGDNGNTSGFMDVLYGFLQTGIWYMNIAGITGTAHVPIKIDTSRLTALSTRLVGLKGWLICIARILEKIVNDSGKGIHRSKAL